MVDDEDEGPRARGPRGRLAIIFTKDCAMRRLCVNALATPRSSSPRFDLRFARAGFKIFLGRSGDGKSFNLNNELRLPTMSGRHVITVRVNEGFTLEGLVQRLGGKGGILTPLSQDTPLTFVFHVSAYAPFDEFDAFLFQLFVSGALSSFTSGTVVALPPSADVQVLIEVPNPVPTHDGAADARKAPKMKRSASNDGVNFTEGTVGDASASAPSEAGPAKPAVSKHCPCVDCLRVVNLGVPYEEMHGCKHMIPTLQCLSPEVCLRFALPALSACVICHISPTALVAAVVVYV